MLCVGMFMKQILDEEITPAMEKLKEVRPIFFVDDI